MVSPVMADQNRPVTGYPVANQNGEAPPPSNASYPYLAPPPPPQQYYYQPYYADPHYTSSRTSFIRSIFCIMISGVIFTGMIFFISWLIVRPQFPLFQVHSLSVSNLNLSTNPSAVSGKFDLELNVRNPNNKVALYYADVQVDIYYSHAALANTMLPPFTQPTENEMALQAKFSPSMSFVRSDVVDGINAEREKSGTMRLMVRIFTWVDFKANGWWNRYIKFSVVCENLMIAIPANAANGTLTGSPRLCHISDW